MGLLACLPCLQPAGIQRVPGYETIKRLGEGIEGEVWLCRDQATEELVAVKLMPRNSPAWCLRMVEHEVSTMLELGTCHPNIVHPKELLLTSVHIGIVQEYVGGGTLAAYLKNSQVDEAMACYFFRQLIAALEYCHKHRIAYRDVKLENTLLDSNSPPRLVVCDFGVSKRWAKGRLPRMQTLAGTPGYISPQLLDNLISETATPYDATKSDVWSAGVLLCIMLMHRFPYGFDDMLERMRPAQALVTLHNLETTQNWRRATGSLQQLSAAVKDLLDQIFQIDEAKRIAVAGIKQHPWFRQHLPEEYEAALRQQREEYRRARRALQLTRQPSHQLRASLDQQAQQQQQEQQDLPEPSPALLLHRARSLKKSRSTKRFDTAADAAAADSEWDALSVTSTNSTAVDAKMVEVLELLEDAQDGSCSSGEENIRRVKLQLPLGS